jgi:hypothetical protein
MYIYIYLCKKICKIRGRFCVGVEWMGYRDTYLAMK